MAVTQGRTWDTGSTVASATVTTAFCADGAKNRYATGTQTDGPKFKCVRFIVDSASAAPLKVNIPNIHGGITFYFTIPVGATQDFVTTADGSRAAMGDFIQVQGYGGTATFSGGIIA